MSLFETCTTLGELNAARIKAVNDGGDIVEVNNAYNAAKTKMLESTRSFGIKLTPIVVKPREVVQYCGIRVCGRSDEVGVIKLTKNGFLY